MSTKEVSTMEPENPISTTHYPEPPNKNSFAPLLTDPDTFAPDTPAPIPGSKHCTLCSTPRNVLIRCQHDATRKWAFVCTGACWRSVSGGQTGGDVEHEFYRYGGTWKNKRAYVSAKIRGKAKEENAAGWRSGRVYKKGTGGKEKLGREVRELRGVDGGDLRVGEDEVLGDWEASGEESGGDGEEWEWDGEVEERQERE